MSATTGASSGRMGGRASTGTRLRKSLESTVRVRVSNSDEDVRVRKKKSTDTGFGGAGKSVIGADVALQLALQAQAAADAAVEAARAAAAVHTSDTASSSANNTSTSSKGRKKQREAAVNALKPKANGTTGKKHGADPLSTNPRKAPKLGQGTRGRPVKVVPSVKYGAGKTYTFEDVCNQGKLISDGKMALNHSNALDENGQRKHPVPKATMARWNKDDAVVMKEEHEGERVYIGESSADAFKAGLSLYPQKVTRWVEEAAPAEEEEEAAVMAATAAL